MSSHETSLRLPNSHLLFQDSAAAAQLRLPSAPPLRRPAADSHPKTRPLTAFFDDKLFSHHRDRYFSADQAAEFRRTLYCGDAPDSNWNGGSEDEEEDDDEDDGDDEDEVDEGDGEVDGLIGVEDLDKGNNGANTINNNHSSNHDNNSSGSVHSGADKIGNGKSKQHSSFASNREVMVKDGENHHQQQQQQQGRIGNFQNAVTIAEPDGDMYYSQYLQGPEGSGAAGQKDLVVENGCGFSGRKDCSFSSESGESLRAILSDPVTGALMDDAMILPCGHSFGSGGIQHVISMKICYTCSLSISEDSIAPNLSLRAAVQAFCREEELQFYRSTKRRKERYDQEKGNNGDSAIMDPPRGRGVQFPFAVTDRVIIKGNKRTPQRFVGREAVVTTQCLNGWYVVKTLDNAESVKLQYRSLAKVSDDPSSKSMSSKIAPSWL